MSSNKKAIFLSLIFGALASAQVYTANVTNGGTGYTSAPTVTASGGSCTTEPTFIAITNSGSVSGLTVTFVGIGCASAPSLSFAGAGSGAAATAVLLPAILVVLSAAPSSSNSGVNPVIGGGYTAWQYECWLTVPIHRVPLYGTTATTNVFRMPGTSQTSLGIASLIGVPAAVQTDMTNGVLTAFDDYVIVASSTSISTVESTLVSACSTAQTNLNNWNPWAYYGSYFNGSSWAGQGIQ